MKKGWRLDRRETRLCPKGEALGPCVLHAAEAPGTRVGSQALWALGELEVSPGSWAVWYRNCPAPPLLPGVLEGPV